MTYRKEWNEEFRPLPEAWKAHDLKSKCPAPDDLMIFYKLIADETNTVHWSATPQKLNWQFIRLWRAV